MRRGSVPTLLLRDSATRACRPTQHYRDRRHPHSHRSRIALDSRAVRLLRCWTNLNDELMADFSNRVRPVVEGIRSERQLWAVFLMDENLVAMMPGLDVSAEVIKWLDAKK